MKPKLACALLGAAAALSLSLGTPALAADHRDAPTIDDYSAIDINDVYMFRMPADCTGGPGCRLVVAVTTQAVADPQFASSYHFQENALYQLNFTTTNADRPPCQPHLQIRPVRQSAPRLVGLPGRCDTPGSGVPAV